MAEEELDIVLRATDDASDTFESVTESAENMGETVQEGAEAGAEGLDEMEESAQSAEDPLESIQDIVSGFVGAEVFSELADTLWDFADKAGTFEDSLMRARLEAEGAGIPVNEMTDAVSELSSVTGRAGSEIRESFIKATARGITDMDSFKKMMTGAGAQATLLGTDIQTMGDKFSSMAQRSTLMERQLASTGITMEELAEAMGMTGATADEVKAKWGELDANQRAAALGLAASMNEGQTANEEYKKSWAGLQEQLDIAKGRLERLVGEVLLPVLIPAIETAARVLDWLGDQIEALINGPFGGLISIIGAVAAAFALGVPAYMAVSGAITLLTATAIPAATALWAMVAPLLPFIAIGAAVVAIIYEMGKAFGWWTDASSMIDAIWAGLQRLWSAFINHPDVQAFINSMRQAWAMLQPYIQRVVDWVKSFFIESDGSKFDLVRALIDAIGKAWDALTLPIRLVIKVVKLLMGVFGNAGNKGKSTVQIIKQAFARLPHLIAVAIASLGRIILQPYIWAFNQIKGVVQNIINKTRSIVNVDVSGITNRLTAPFTRAYEKIANTVSNIIQKAKSIPSNIPIIGGMFGGEDLNAYGGEDLTTTTYTKEDYTINQNINLSLDLRNVPPSVNEEQLYGMIDETIHSREFIKALTQNNDFQTMDKRAKQRINAKTRRARGA